MAQKKENRENKDKSKSEKDDPQQQTLLDFPAESIAQITLSLPERRNALSLEMRAQLRERLESLAADASVRAIILTGADNCFCAGGDIKSMEGITVMGGRKRLEDMHRLARLITRMEKPIVAAVEGFAMGAGLSLAALCDIVVAAENSLWSCPFNQVGLIPDTGALWGLPQRMGVGRARRLMMLGKKLDGKTAIDEGLADILCESGAALDTAIETCHSLISKAPCALAMTKAILANFPQSLEQSLAAERECQALLFQSKDFAEGRAAFYEKRKPKFCGD